MSRGRVRRVTSGTAAGAGAIVLLTMPMGAQGGQGATSVTTASNTSATTTFTFAGAVEGTLTQPDLECNGVGGYGGMFEFEANRLKGSSDSSWVVNVNNLGAKRNGGTFTNFGGITGNGVSIVLQGSNGKTDYFWASKSGKVTISPSGGSLKVVLVPDRGVSGKPGKGTIHLTGSWGCTGPSS